MLQNTSFHYFLRFQGEKRVLFQFLVSELEIVFAANWR